MQLRSILFGFGTGMVLISMMFYFGLFLVEKNQESVEPVVVDYTDDEIIEKARKLGMVLMKELPQEESKSTEPTESEVVAMAEALGYELTKLPEDDDPEVLEPDEGEEEIPLVYDGDGIVVVIPAGSHSSDVAEILASSGVIDSADAFTSHVIWRGYTTRLKAGTFIFEEGLTYDQVLDTLMGKY